jgi:PAS domain S-box-containing protein
MEELLANPIERLIPEMFRHKHVDHRKKYTRHPKSRPMGVGMDLFGVKKDGTEFPVEVSLGSFQDNGASNVIAFISDISIRKKAENEIKELNDHLEATVEQRTKDLKQTLQKLERSTDILGDVLSYQKALLDNAGAMIIATNEKGIVTLFNPEAATNLGYSEAEIINKHTLVLFHDKAEIESKRIELYDKFGLNIKDDFSVLVEKSRRNIHEEEQYTYIRKNRTSIPVSLTLTAITGNEGNITGFMAIAIDISERKKAEEDLRRSLEKEKDLSELKSRFVSMASHEFRTPLSTVLSSAYLIEKYTSGEDQPKRNRHVQRIISSVNMLTDILNDFLSVGKIEEGKIQVRLSRFNIHEAINAIIQELKITLKKEQQIKYSHEGNTEVYLDLSMLKHIVMNLISNASKFSAEDSCINIKTQNVGDEVSLSVKDNGMGISIEDQKHLMERFFRGANAANIQGTGLGLHIVAKYAELLNGRVKCISDLQKGTEFEILFNTKLEI